ncbi:zeta toxin family protein [Aquirufa echingensis]|jgi:predicted ABC-type ATPase|uniref:Zeta toxin family protein n=1 Tax=Aquirufa echingensis TaxID=3096516 RepID=A0ABW6CUV8_9BACT
MHNPRLLVIAGCNGSGKSSFSKFLVPSSNTIPFDYDSHFLSHYRALIDIDIKEQMAHNLASTDLNDEIEEAWKSRKDFAFETNFDTEPMYWPNQFKAKGYDLFLIFLCLDSIELANKRVLIRVENGGHFVSTHEVERRYYAGFENLNKYYAQFDFIDIFEGSAHARIPEHMATVENGKVVFSTLDRYLYLKNLIPELISR